MIDAQRHTTVRQCPPKVLGQFVKFTKFIQPHNSSNPTQYNQFSAKTDAGYQTIWIEDQAQRFVGPDLRSILFVQGIIRYRISPNKNAPALCKTPRGRSYQVPKKLKKKRFFFFFFLVFTPKKIFFGGLLVPQNITQYYSDRFQLISMCFLKKKLKNLEF